MRKIIIPICFVALVFQQVCAQSLVYDSLQTPLLFGQVASGGTWQYGNRPIGSSSFGWPAVTYKNGRNQLPLVYAGSTWFSGKVENQFFAQWATFEADRDNLYTQPGGRPGPIAVGQTTPSSDSAMMHWNKVFICTRAEVEAFRYTYYRGISLAEIPQHILAWPGSRNPHLGFAVPNDMAPFIDVNNDGTYEPLDGDYPALEAYAQAFSITNYLHPNGGNIRASSIGLMVKTNVIQIEPTTNDSYFNRSLLVRQSFVNQSPQVVSNCRVGIWQSVGVGNGSDDYVQFDVARNMAFVFNGDDYDDSLQLGHTLLPGFGANPPAFGCTILQTPLADANDSVDNNRNAIVDEYGEETSCASFMVIKNTTDFVTGIPTNVRDGYNYMRSTWKNGTSMIYHTGNASGGTDSIHPFYRAQYMYPGHSDPIGYGVGGSPQNPIALPAWTEASAGNIPGDRQWVMSTGSFTMQPGQQVSFAYGMLVSKYDPAETDSTAAVRNLLAARDSLAGYFQVLSQARKSIQPLAQRISLAPNPAHSTITVYAERSVLGQPYTIYDLAGRSVQQGMVATQIAVDHLPPGSYQIHIRSSQGLLTTKFVKQ